MDDHGLWLLVSLGLVNFGSFHILSAYNTGITKMLMNTKPSTIDITNRLYAICLNLEIIMGRRCLKYDITINVVKMRWTFSSSPYQATWNYAESKHQQKAIWRSKRQYLVHRIIWHQQLGGSYSLQQQQQEQPRRCLLCISHFFSMIYLQQSILLSICL